MKTSRLFTFLKGASRSDVHDECCQALATINKSTSGTITLRVIGMTCEECAGRIKRDLEKLDGVKHVTVKFRESMAFVEYDTEKLDVSQLIGTMSTSGGYRKLYVVSEY